MNERRKTKPPRKKPQGAVKAETATLLRKPMTLDQAYGSVKPLPRRLTLKRVRDIAIDEHVERVLEKEATMKSPRRKLRARP